MADADALRVQVRVTADLHPELFAALSLVRPRGRADRLRQLALLGLTSQRCADPREGDPAALPISANGSVADRAETPDPRRARILGALTLAD